MLLSRESAALPKRDFQTDDEINCSMDIIRVSLLALICFGNDKIPGKKKIIQKKLSFPDDFE